MGHESSNNSKKGHILAFGAVFLAVSFLILWSDLHKGKQPKEEVKTEQTTH